METYGMEIFVIGLCLLLLAAVLAMLAASIKQDVSNEFVAREDTDAVTDDVRLVQSCKELKQLAARVRKEIKHG